MPRLRYSTVFSYGGIYPAIRGDGYWREAKDIATKMADSHKDKMPSRGACTPHEIGCSSYHGLYYYITFRVDGDNGFTAVYEAKVLCKAARQGTEVISFEKVIGSERKTKSFMTGGSKMCDEKACNSKKGKEGLDLFKGLSTPVLTSNTDLVCVKDSSKLRTHAFYILLEQIRSQRPSWKYAKARKAASSIWRTLLENVERMLVLR